MSNKSTACNARDPSDGDPNSNFRPARSERQGQCTSASKISLGAQQSFNYSPTDMIQNNNIVIQGTDAQWTSQHVSHASDIQAYMPVCDSNVSTNYLKQSKPAEVDMKQKGITTSVSSGIDGMLSSQHTPPVNRQGSNNTLPKRDVAKDIGIAVQNSSQQGHKSTVIPIKMTGQEIYQMKFMDLMPVSHMYKSGPIGSDRQKRSVAKSKTSEFVERLLETESNGYKPNHYQATAFSTTPNSIIQGTAAQEPTQTTAIKAYVANQGANAHVGGQIATKYINQMSAPNCDNEKGSYTEISEGTVNANSHSGRGNFNFIFKQPAKCQTPVTAVLIGSPQSVKVNYKPAKTLQVLANEEILRLKEEKSFTSSQTEVTFSQSETTTRVSSVKTTQYLPTNEGGEMNHSTDFVNWIRSGNMEQENVDETVCTKHQSILQPVDKSSIAANDKSNAIPDWTDFLTNKPQKIDNSNNIQNIGSLVQQRPPISSVKIVENKYLTPAANYPDRNSMVESISCQNDAHQNLIPSRSKRTRMMGSSNTEIINNTDGPQYRMPKYYNQQVQTQHVDQKCPIPVRQTNQKYMCEHNNSTMDSGNIDGISNTNIHQNPTFNQPISRECNPNICNQIIGTEDWPSYHHHVPYNYDINSRPIACTNILQPIGTLQTGKTSSRKLQYSGSINSGGRQIVMNGNIASEYRVPHIDLNTGRQYPTIEDHKHPPLNVVEVTYDVQEGAAAKDHSRGNPNVTTADNVNNSVRGNAVVNRDKTQQRINVHTEGNHPRGLMDEPMSFQPTARNGNAIETTAHSCANPTVNECGYNTWNSVQPTTDLIQDYNRQARTSYDPSQFVVSRSGFPKRNGLVPYNYKNSNDYIMNNAEYYTDHLPSAYYVDRNRPSPICNEPCPEVGPDNRCNVPRTRYRQANKTQTNKSNTKATAGIKPIVTTYSEGSINNKSNASVGFQQMRQTFNESAQTISTTPYYTNTMQVQSTDNQYTQATHTQYNQSASSAQMDDKNGQQDEHVFKIPRLPKVKKDKEPRGRPY